MSPSPEEIEAYNRQVLDDTKAEFDAFIADFVLGRCNICGRSIDSFKATEPCLHWLLRPEGVDKKHIEEVLKSFDFSQVEAYVKWVANSEVIFGNINDLVEGKKSSRIIEETIKFKDIEWSFSCAETDLKGHEGSLYGKDPHYHFQMIINGKIFFRYSDFHIPFAPMDLFMLDVRTGKFPEAKWFDTFSMGMQGATNELPPEVLLSLMKGTQTEDLDTASFRVQTILHAEEGKTISGADIIDAFNESQEKNIPIATLVNKMKNIGSAQTVILPGDGVPEKADRKGGRGSKRNLK
jgi:hypothetical protein